MFLQARVSSLVYNFMLTNNEYLICYISYEFTPTHTGHYLDTPEVASTLAILYVSLEIT